jgi:hypothetical protein
VRGARHDATSLARRSVQFRRFSGGKTPDLWVVTRSSKLHLSQCLVGSFSSLYRSSSHSFYTILLLFLVFE